MNNIQRTSPLMIATFAVIGAGAGLLLQLLRSTKGQAPLVPPLSLAFTPIVLGLVLLFLGIALRRAVTQKSGKPVNPFHAVRLLAGARSGQFVGALLGGFGSGLVLQLLTRTVMPPTATWIPMVAVVIGSAVLLICGAVAETLCKVPPNDGDGNGGGTSRGAEPGTAPGAEPGAA